MLARHLVKRPSAGLMPGLLSCLLSLSACAPLPSPPVAMDDGPMALRRAAAVTATPVAEPAVLAPPTQMHTEGVPAIPRTLVADVGRYTEFQGHSLLTWHPQRRELLLAHRGAGSNTSQLWRAMGPGADLLPLTDGAEPVSWGRYEPQEGRYLVFRRAQGGNEVHQLHRLDLRPDGSPSGPPVQLTDPNERHDFNLWLKRPGQATLMVSGSQPLDRTAVGGKRTEAVTRLWLTDPLQPASRQLLAELSGGGWEATAASPDGSQLALLRYLSAEVSEIWLLPVPAAGAQPQTPRRLLPAQGDARGATHLPVAWQPDGTGLLLLSDRAGEFHELMRLDLRSGALTRLTAHIPWDVSVAAESTDLRQLLLLANEDGVRRLHVLDGNSMQVRPVADLPAGTVLNARLHPRTGELALSVSSHTGPSQVWSLPSASPATPAGGAARTATAWAHARTAPGVDTQSFAPQSLVRWNSFDGRQISGLLTRPPARFTGKRPVLIRIHGGPASQAQAGFLGRYNYFVEELGVAVLQPNVRGSTGYGKTFVALDNGLLREDSVRDIGSLLDWIATQPDLDPQRVLVTGGSYGGYMSLAVAVHYGDRIAGAIDVVGISHFVSFLQNTETYRRDLRRVEYGDEREPAMRAFLDRISPLTQAHRIRKPLMVVQGRNDPRVPWTEAEQIVARARAQGTPVWYLRAENEGHGFARKDNADYEFYATVMFMRETLLQSQGSTGPKQP